MTRLTCNVTRKIVVSIWYDHTILNWLWCFEVSRQFKRFLLLNLFLSNRHFFFLLLNNIWNDILSLLNSKVLSSIFVVIFMRTIRINIVKKDLHMPIAFEWCSPMKYVTTFIDCKFSYF